MKRRGSILVGVLWCMALLSVVVITVLHRSRMDLLTVKNYGDRIQAHYLALAGVERAKALLYHDYITRRQAGINHTGTLFNDAKDFENVQFGRGQIRVLRRGSNGEGGGLIYGVSDEESRLNINTAFEGELTNLNGLTPDIARSILAWRSDVGQGANGGAEDEYYQSQQPPYVARHGPFQTVRELLMVRDVTRGDLLGSDAHQNDLLDPDDESSVTGDGGWATLLTANSAEKNFNAFGKQRVNIQNADQNALTGIDGITDDIARAIIAYRGTKQYQSIADLLDVPAQNNSAGNQNQTGNSGGNTQNVIDQDLFMRIADSVSISGDEDQAGMININTAAPEVLACLPGMDIYLAQAIVSFRQSNGFFDNIGTLLRVGGMTRDIFRQIAPLITARSETFRITAEGRISSSGTTQRVQAIVHIASHEIVTLAYREDL